MASATRYPIKTVGFTAAVLIAAGASRVNVKKLLESTFTGPGSYSRVVAAVVILFNLKNAPWAWHVSLSIPYHTVPSPAPSFSPNILT